MNAKQELAKMTTKELEAYNSICRMSLACIQSQEDMELNQSHLDITEELLSERRPKGPTTPYHTTYYRPLNL